MRETPPCSTTQTSRRRRTCLLWTTGPFQPSRWVLQHTSLFLNRLKASHHGGVPSRCRLWSHTVLCSLIHHRSTKSHTNYIKHSNRVHGCSIPAHFGGVGTRGGKGLGAVGMHGRQDRSGVASGEGSWWHSVSGETNHSTKFTLRFGSRPSIPRHLLGRFFMPCVLRYGVSTVITYLSRGSI